MNKKFLIILIIFVITFNIFSADQPVDTSSIPKVEAPKNENADSISKEAENAKKMTEKFKKKKEKLPEPKGPVVAFLPFNYTYVVGEANGMIAMNEIVVAMVKSQAFTPSSLKTWADKRYSDGRGKDIHQILADMRTFKVPADYVCYGYIFRSGNEFGLKVSFYPVKANMLPSYYFRTFKNINQLPKIALQIVDEMKSRALEQKQSLTKRKILINNFDLNYLIYSKSETGEINISPLPFIKLAGMEYKKEDFFNELMLYNFNISRIFNVYNNNIRNYTQNTKYGPTISYDYTINTSLNLSKEIKQITFEVLDSKNQQVFSNSYRFEKLNLSDLYNEMRKWVKDITLTLLSDDELKLAGEVALNSLYSNEDIFLDGFYIGRGDQKNLIVPTSASTVKIWTGEIAYTEKALNPKSYVEKYINVVPYKTGISKPPMNFFNLSVGANILGGFYFHPQYNTQQKVIFHNDILKTYKNYNMGDILLSPVIENKFNDTISYMAGLGVDLSLENRYIMLTNQVNLKFGHYQQNFKTEPKEAVDISSEQITKLKFEYELMKFNFALDYSFLPSVMFLKQDSPVRMYGGVGFYTMIWYSFYNESIKGTATLVGGSTNDYRLDTAYENRQTVMMIMGIFPEIGTIIKYGKFNIKLGLSYYFDLYKTSFWTNSEYGSFEQFNAGSLIAKIGFGYYLK